MTTPTALKTSRDLVQKAETAYQNGDDITCARLLWEATFAAFQELAANMGHPCHNQNEARKFAKTLDQEKILRDYNGILNFGITMLEHSQGADWTEDPEFAWQFDEFPLAIAVTSDGLNLLQSKMTEV